MANGRIDENGLPVYAPGDFDYVRVVDRSTGASRNALVPEVTAAARVLTERLDEVVAEAEADIAPVIAGLGYLPPVPYAAGLNVNSTRFTVIREGQVYAPSAPVPFTTGAWDAGQWRVIQGVVAPDLLSATGSAMVGFLQAGAGAVLRDLLEKGRESVSVKDFGAIGSGEDSTLAFQRALATGKVIYAPAGEYRLNFLNIPSNSIIIGDGESTVIRPATDGIRCALGADSGSATAFVENIHIAGVKFLGNVGAVGFAEHSHLASFNGVKNMVIERCSFVGYRGDGIYLGSGNSAAQERHNVNVTIRNCLFDGVNFDNRNGISVIDGDTVSIESCVFRRTTRANMPGAIDCEPNAYDFAVLRNVTIRGCLFESGNSFGVALLLRPQSTLLVKHHNFLIEGNLFATEHACSMAGATSGLTDSTEPYGVTFRRNTALSPGKPLFLYGPCGVDIVDNLFIDCGLPVEVGYTPGSRHVAFRGNRFVRCGAHNTLGTRAILVQGNTKFLTFDSNTFIDCGRENGTAGRAVEFVAGGSGAHITMRNNIYTSPTGRTNYWVFNAGAGFVLDHRTCVAEGENFAENKATDFTPMYAQVTHDWPELAAGAQQSLSVPVPGALVSDFVRVSANQPLMGTRIWGEVTAAGTVTLYHQNGTTAPVNMGNAIYRIHVTKPNRPAFS